MNDLKPCPFCGSDNVEYQLSWSHGFVVCNNCYAKGPLVADLETANKAWNERVSSEHRAAPSLAAAIREFKIWDEFRNAALRHLESSNELLKKIRDETEIVGKIGE